MTKTRTARLELVGESPPHRFSRFPWFQGLKLTDIEKLDYAFPVVDPGLRPLANRVLVQIRRVKDETDGGVLLADETKETEKWNEMTALVISVGPLAYRDRNTMAEWPEGAWCVPGDFVRVPKYGGDRTEVPMGVRVDPALFVTIKDIEVISMVTKNPLTIKTFV